MLQGAQWHAAGKPELALDAFEAALTLVPGEVNAASACATLLSELDRPQAAYRILLSVEAALMADPDGAANLAIAAEACGDLAKAQACYARALTLNPDHLRALNNVGILAASAGQWDIAAELARKCLTLDSIHVQHHANLCEFLSGDQRYQEALGVVATAIAQFPDALELKVRHVALLAFNGDLENSDAEMARLPPQARAALDEFLLKLESPEERHVHRIRTRNNPSTQPDALDIFAGQAFRKLSACDWRNNTRLTAVLRASLAASAGTAGCRHRYQAPFYGPMLGLDNSEIVQIQRESRAADVARARALLPAFDVRPKAAIKNDGRLHIGLSLDNLRDERQRRALVHQLAHHDANRFAVHVYAFTAHPDAQHADPLRSVAASVAELGHMSDVEAVARIRLDRLDVYVEISPEGPFRRPLISALRVAAIQIQSPPAHGQAMPGWDYIIADEFMYPAPPDPGSPSGGAIVRLPETSWLATPRATPGGPSQMGNVGLPEDGLVLCALMPPETLDPQSFAAWMKILRALPDAVLWLPRCGRAAAHLVREAKAAGVGAERLLFSTSQAFEPMLAALTQTSLCLDTFLTNSARALEDALNAGIPALTFAGNGMASRTGGSILRAAGLPDCVMPSAEAYVRQAVRLGRDTRVLAALKERLLASRSVSPLFDTQTRIRQWECAWTMMVERFRAGLPPAAFDVPASGKNIGL